jgi:hypothetical protein
LAVLAVPLSGADRTEESVFGEYPHRSLLLRLPLDLDHIRSEKAEFVVIELADWGKVLNESV